MRTSLLSTSVLFLLNLLFIGGIQANGQTFEELRYDELIPEYCHNPNFRHFERIQDWPVYGIEGALRQGFDYEYDLSRSDATWLWQAFKDGREPNRWPRRLNDEVRTILEFKEPMGFDFGSEGEVLELLALVDLQKEYDPRDFFFTGGLQYHNDSGRTLGELDVLVGERRTCNFIVVGEAKLGTRSLRKAREQLERFENFLNQNSILENGVFEVFTRLY